MRIIAFVGQSGTGKSYNAISVAKKYNIKAIIDDGLFIMGNTIIGISAKREVTRIASIRRALFTDPKHKEAVISAIKKYKPETIMILGTSDAMTEKIAKTLALPEISQYIHIEDVSSPEEIALAHNIRVTEGQHVIPVPTFSIKKYFSGYFLHPLRLLQKNLDEKNTYDDEKSIVRPTFSYMGQYTISDNVLIKMATHEATTIPYINKVYMINIRTTNHGIHIDMTISLKYGCNIHEVCTQIQNKISKKLQEYTSINIRRVNILVKDFIIDN